MGPGPDLEMPAREELRLVDVLQALADPVRLELVHLLADGDGQVPCGQLPLPVSKATASHHFKVLREAGIAQVRYEGTRRYYSLRRDDLEARFPGLLASVLDAADERAAASASHPV